MRTRSFSVILTAAITSLLTFLLAARYNEKIPFIGGSKPQLPVNYASYASNAVRGNTPVDFQEAAEASVKAVVHIKTQTAGRILNTGNDPFGNDLLQQMFGQQAYIPPQQGSGSGVVISHDGFIVTNNHVVAGADQVTVTFNDRYTTAAKVISTDASTDIAVLKVNEKNLSFMEFGNSDEVRLGQWVLAVGYPLTLDATVTAGIVSAKGRSIGINKSKSANAIEAFIQTDAAVNPGNSGGALVNTNGQLIGINSAIASPTGSYAGYSYAIPANLVKKVVNDLMQYGSVQRAVLGINYLDRKSATPEQLSALGIDRADGVYVQGVLNGSGAAQAGLQKGDFITQINGAAVHTEPELLEQLARYKPGDNISLTYVRNGNAKMATVQLKNVEGTTSIIKQASVTRVLGADFRSLNAEEKKKYNVKGGVMVTEIDRGSLAQQTNMRKGFVITEINDKPVTSIEELQKILGSSNSAQIAGFYPGYNGRYYYGLNDISSGGNEQ